MSRIAVGDRVIAGTGPDREAGTVLEIHGSTATVAWDQEACRTPADVAALEPEGGAQ